MYIQIIGCSKSLCAINELLDFGKDVWNLDIFDWEQKNCVFLPMFFHLPFYLELSSRHMASTSSYMCLFMSKRHLKHFHAKCVKNISRKREITNHMKNKHKPIFDPSQRYHDSINLLQNPKVPKTNIGFNNCAQSFTTPYYMDA